MVVLSMAGRLCRGIMVAIALMVGVMFPSFKLIERSSKTCQPASSEACR
jgi:hypothetical protein